MTKTATLFRRIGNLLTMEGAARKSGRHAQLEDLGLMPKAAILVQDGRIAWIGPERRLPREWSRRSLKEWDLQGRTVLPGFVECHTHLVFAGHRADEFEQRIRGVSYQEIAARGGGILSTMKKTRAASTAMLAKDAQKHADLFLRQGVTTLEAKSGYALNLKDELRMLEAAGRIENLRMVRTFLGAHALPPEFKSYEEYLEFLAQKVLPEVHRRGLAQRVDIFIEKGFFPLEASKKYLSAAKALGFDIVIHADQLSLSGGGEAAVELGALSADHVIQLQAPQIAKMASSSVTSVLLPSADLYMKCAYPPARALIDAGARVALATDFNPGSSPSQDLNLVGLLARLEMKMTLPEVLTAYTVGAAHALNLAAEVGSLEVGKSADFFSTTQGWETLFYSIGQASVDQVFVKGRLASGPKS